MVVQQILILSHGQASVERGFSINKEIEVENLLEESLVAQRIIYDHIVSKGGIVNVTISKELMLSVSAARQKYMTYLDDMRKQKLQMEQKKRKLTILDEIEDLKKKRKRLEKDIDILMKSADEMADKAENTGRVAWITKSNSLRRTAKNKQEELKSLRSVIDEKTNSLRD
jgi:hypothetical protein